MSSRRMNQKSMFCKVCKDAGLCEKMFTSHNVKDIRGQVCCPTLRNNVCSRCNCRGHTPSYCPGSKQQAVMVRIVKHAAVPSKKAPAAAVPSNTFASLDEDSDEEDEVCDLKPHPNVTVRPVCMLRVSKRCWADMEDDDEELHPNVTVRAKLPLKYKPMAATEQSKTQPTSWAAVVKNE